MKKYSIILLPEFNNQSWIEQVRRQYDPDGNRMPPHISLVFPFETEMAAAEIGRIMEFALYRFRHFDLEMADIVRRGTRIHLEVRTGYEFIYEMQGCLYSTILAEYKPEWLRHVTYIPHMTLGVMKTIQEAEQVLRAIRIPEQRLKTVVRKVYLEELRGDDSSEIIMEHKLRAL